MAANDKESGSLTGSQYVRLSEVISCSKMESIALRYLGIKIERIEQLKESRKDDPQGFVRAAIYEWASRHPENQVQVRKAVHHFLLQGQIQLSWPKFAKNCTKMKKI